MSAAYDVDWSRLFGARTVRAECLPFARISHTAPLFLDYLSGNPQVRKFYPRPASFQQWFKEEAAALRYDVGRRWRVAAALERQNGARGASEKTRANSAR